MPWMPLIPMLVIAAPWQLVGVLLKVAGGRPFRKIPAEKKGTLVSEKEREYRLLTTDYDTGYKI